MSFNYKPSYIGKIDSYKANNLNLSESNIKKTTDYSDLPEFDYSKDFSAVDGALDSIGTLFSGVNSETYEMFLGINEGIKKIDDEIRVLENQVTDLESRIQDSCNENYQDDASLQQSLYKQIEGLQNDKKVLENCKETIKKIYKEKNFSDLQLKDDFKEQTKEHKEYINMIIDTRGYYGSVDNVDQIDNTSSFMTEEEKNIALYLYNTEGGKGLKRYLDFKEQEFNSREGFYKAALFLEDLNASDEVSKFLKTTLKGLGDGTNRFIDGIANLAYGIDGVISADEFEAMYIVNYLTPEQIDGLPNLTEEEKNNLKKIKGLSGTYLEHVYGVSSGIGNMLPAIAASTATSIALTPVGGEIVGSVLMGLSSAGNSAESAYQQGHSYWESMLYGGLNGASEATLGYFLGGIPGLSKLSGLSGWQSFVVNLSKEAGEESLQVIIDSCIKTVVLEEEFNIDWQEVKKSGIYGLVTAGIMNGGTIVIDGVSIDVNSISTKTTELLANAENLGIKIDYSKINDKTYINSFNQYNNYVALCNKFGITEIVDSETFYSNPEIIDYSFIMKQVKQKLINTNVDTYLSNPQEIIELLNEVALVGSPAELVEIFRELSNSNSELCDQLLLNSSDIYIQILTKQLLEPTLDYYNEAVNFANSNNAKAFKTYRTHCETHVEEVAQKSMEAAVAVSDFYKASNSGTVNLFELYVASIWHDVGMAAGSDVINGINSRYNKRTKEWKPEILEEMNKGNDTRSNHALNSALAILDNSSYFSETLGMDPNIIALSVFAHSKSNSGVTNLTVEADWMRGIKVLDDCYALYNKEFYPNETKKSFIDLCKESGIIEIKNGEISLTEKALKELSGNSFALRLGDANTTTANAETIYNQANQEITYDILKGSGLKLDQFQEIFNGDTVTVHELICIEFGIDYEIVPNKKTGELEVKCISSPNEKVEIQVGGEKISLDQFTVGFILGENNISFNASSTSPIGEVDGKLHEICTIKDSNVVMPTIFNINERLGEVTSGIKKGSGQTASIDIVFPTNTSTDVIDMYKEVIRSGYFSNSVEYNLYIEDSNGNIKKYN